MNRAERRSPAYKKAFAAEQAKQPDRMTFVPEEKWPANSHSQTVIAVWRSKKFLAVVWKEGDNTRLTVNRAKLTASGKWGEEVTWDELQQIKREVGFGSFWAVECFPPDDEVVNVANMRHLWILEERPAYGW